MNEECLDTSPEGTACIRKRGHSGPKKHHRDEQGRTWFKSGEEAYWAAPGIKATYVKTARTYDDGYMSEGEYQAMSSYGYGSRAPWGW